MSNIVCKKAKEKIEWIKYVIDLIYKEWVKVDYDTFYKKRMDDLNNSDEVFILLDDDTPIGCFAIVYNDIKSNPKYNPNLACVCIDEKYRGNGYSKYILKYSIEELKKMGIGKAYLKTSLKGFYEKVGWEPINEFYKNEQIYKIEF